MRAPDADNTPLHPTQKINIFTPRKHAPARSVIPPHTHFRYSFCPKLSFPRKNGPKTNLFGLKKYIF
jgi:hypothetical protein